MQREKTLVTLSLSQNIVVPRIPECLEIAVLPVALPILHARITMRLLGAARLPAYKGGVLRGGFGYAFQQTSCPRECWEQSEHCPVALVCPFRQVFATPHPPNIAAFHDLRDVPRPFVIEPPLDSRERYQAGDALEFHLVLIGRGIDYLPYFLFSFEQLASAGLGIDRAKARLERVEALEPWSVTGTTIYSDGKVADTAQLPTYTAETIAERAATLPDTFALHLSTPLRLKSQGDYLRRFDMPALVQAICWRLSTLNVFHGDGQWQADHRAMVALAQQVHVENPRVQWVDWERTSNRYAEPQHMNLGGIVGEVVLRQVPVELRALLLAAQLVHIGKACVFGHGRVNVADNRATQRHMERAARQ